MVDSYQSIYTICEAFRDVESDRHTLASANADELMKRQKNTAVKVVNTCFITYSLKVRDPEESV